MHRPRYSLIQNGSSKKLIDETFYMAATVMTYWRQSRKQTKAFHRGKEAKLQSAFSGAQ